MYMYLRMCFKLCFKQNVDRFLSKVLVKISMDSPEQDQINSSVPVFVSKKNQIDV